MCTLEAAPLPPPLVGPARVSEPRSVTLYFLLELPLLELLLQPLGDQLLGELLRVRVRVRVRQRVK